MFKIRKFKEEDTSAVIRVITTVLREMFNCRQDEIKKNLRGDVVADLKNIIKNYIEIGGVFYVGEYDGKVIGTVAVTPENKNTAVFRRFYLYKKYRGRGFGSKLYNKAEKWAKDKNYKKLILFTFPFFEVAVKMYKKRGYGNFKKVKGRKITCSKKI